MSVRVKTQIRKWIAIAALMAGAVPALAQLPAARAQQDRCAGPLGALVPGCQGATGGAHAAMPNLPGMAPAPTVPGDLGSARTVAPEPREVLAPLPPEPPSEFQRFVAASAGKTLPVFGASLFDRAPTTFAPVDRAPVTADYVVGPGDQILLRVWGQVALNLDLTVDRSGSIYIPQVGSLSVAGLEFRQLPGFLKTQLEQVFRNFDLNVNMGQLRSIQVFVVGSARRPGSYTVSSLSTLVNVVFASGGPAAEGSMRRIQLKRENKVVTEFDLYDLLLRGDKSKDARLLPGDLIYYPPAGAQVAVAGSVKTPAIFERKQEQTAAEWLAMAGGLTQVADPARVVLERIGKNGERTTLHLQLNAAGDGTPIENGDILQVAAVPARIHGVVTLRGNVANPGRFPWRAGMRLRDIIPDKESLVTQQYWRRRNLLGFMPAADTGTADPVATGLPRDTAPINWSYAVVERRDPRDLSTQLLTFHPGKLLLDGDTTENLELSAGDVVTLFSQTDIRVPQAQQSRFVRLEGEIQAAGIYAVKPGETLAQVLRRAGGLTPQAYTYGAEFMRESTRREQQARLDQLVRDWDRELEQQGMQRSERAVAEEDVARLKAEQETARRLIERARAVKATGRIVLGMDRDQRELGKLMELPLEDGDVFMVPARPATISVLGAVYNQNAFLHEENLRVMDYLREAGGTTRTADKDRVFIIRADGSVVPRQDRKRFGNSFETTRLNPGDALVIPEAMPKTPLLRSLRDWTQVFSQLILGAAAVNVLR
jgi:polysaccharide export outer membrane protein